MDNQQGKDFTMASNQAINPTTLHVEIVQAGSEVWLYNGKELVQGQSGQGLIEFAAIIFIFFALAYAVSFILDGNMDMVELLCKVTNNCGATSPF